MRESLSRALSGVERLPKHITDWLGFQWSLVVGKELASVTRVERLNVQTLHVAVADIAWLPALKTLEGKIISGINHQAREDILRNLVFKEDKTMATKTNPAPLRKAAQEHFARPSENPVQGNLEMIKDADLRGILTRLEKKMRFSLAWVAAFLWTFVANCASVPQPAKSDATVWADSFTSQEVKILNLKNPKAGYRDPQAYYHYLMALRAEQKFDFDEAIKHYREVVAHDSASEGFHLQLARLHLRQGQVDRVIEVCNNGLKSFPSNSDLLLLLANALLSRGEPDQALSSIQQAFQQKSTDPEAYLIAGMSYQKIKKWDQAKDMFENMIRVDPNNPLGHHYISRVYAEMENYPKAEETLKRSLELKPNFQKSRELLAWVLEKTKKYNEAAQEYQILMKLDPDDKNIRNKFIQMNQAAGNTGQGGLFRTDEVPDILPEDSNVHLKVGALFYEQTKYIDALEEFRLLLAENENPGVRLLVAKIYELFEQYDQAIAEVQVVHKQDPDSVDILVQLARLYNMNKRTRSSVEVLQQAIKLRPDIDDLHHSLSLAYMNLGMYPDAIASIRRALELDNTKSTYYFEMGALQERVGNYDEAIKNMKQVIEINPLHSNAHNFIGYLYAIRGDNLDLALSHLEKALSVQPQNGYFLDSLGWVYFKNGDAGRALAEIKKAMIYTPPDPVLYDHLGDIYHALKNYSEAGKAWRLSLTLTRKKEKESLGGELPDAVKLENKIKNLDKLLQKSL